MKITHWKLLHSKCNFLYDAFFLMMKIASYLYNTRPMSWNSPCSSDRSWIPAVTWTVTVSLFAISKQLRLFFLVKFLFLKLIMDLQAVQIQTFSFMLKLEYIFANRRAIFSLIILIEDYYPSMSIYKTLFVLICNFKEPANCVMRIRSWFSRYFNSRYGYIYL